MELIAIDPGPVESAICWNNNGQLYSQILPNPDILVWLKNEGFCRRTPMRLAIEMIASYGMPVGREVFETCMWIGRFIQAHLSAKPENEYSLIYRKDVKIHLCGSMKAKDGNIRQSLLDKYGPQGTKKEPGPTYGFKADMWAALAVWTYAKESEELKSGAV